MSFRSIELQVEHITVGAASLEGIYTSVSVSTVPSLIPETISLRPILRVQYSHLIEITSFRWEIEMPTLLEWASGVAVYLVGSNGSCRVSVAGGGALEDFILDYFFLGNEKGHTSWGEIWPDSGDSVGFVYRLSDTFTLGSI